VLLAGAQKLARIRENSNFFRSELKKMGFEVLGDNDSPVMPIMLYNPAKIPAFSRECFRQKVSSARVCRRNTLKIRIAIDRIFCASCRLPLSLWRFL
jgi:7-keto-8-aminopelargonate synthetase-like enzyme